jgi:hypothetical protein
VLNVLTIKQLTVQWDITISSGKLAGKTFKKFLSLTDIEIGRTGSQRTVLREFYYSGTQKKDKSTRALQRNQH